jgi:hypothetical protein
MTLAELQAAVIVITNRPDLVSETVGAIRKAVFKMHSADTWSQDFKEVVVPLGASLYTNDFKYSLDLTSTLISKFRAALYLREYSAAQSSALIDFTRIEPDYLFDSYHVEKRNYFYHAGDSLVLRADKVLTSVQLGYYKFPDTASASFSSWIARDFPDCIIDEASSIVFKAIGKDEEFARFAALAKENIAMLQMSQLP